MYIDWDIFRDLVLLPSEQERKEYIKNFLMRRGIEFVDDFNIVVLPRGRGEIFFDAHIDTVERIKDFVEEGSIFYGTGVADNIANVFILLQLLDWYGIPESAYIVFTLDEEVGGEGAKRLELPVKYAVVLEPTKLELIVYKCVKVLEGKREEKGGFVGRGEK